MIPNVDTSALVYCVCSGHRVPYGECAGSFCDCDSAESDEYPESEPEADDEEPLL